MPDGMLLTPDDFQRLDTPEQAANFVEDKIQAWSDWTLRKPPPPTNVITSREYLIWERRLMMAYGEVVGAMQALYAVGKISAAQFKALKLRVISSAVRKAGAVQMGVDP